MPNKLKSFTIAELLVTMIITVIVVGMAFAVLRYVNQTIYKIEKNYKRINDLLLFEERLALDMSNAGIVIVERSRNRVYMINEISTTRYQFGKAFVLRNSQKIDLTLEISEVYLNGQSSLKDTITGISVNCGREFPDYNIHVSRSNDCSVQMNQDGI